MKKYQVLTEESIAKIENAIEMLEDYEYKHMSEIREAIEDLKQILKDVEDEN